jgi:hypothetical protein
MRIRISALFPAAVLAVVALDATGSATAPASPAPVCPPAQPPAPAATAAKVRAPATTLVACVATTPIDGASFDHWALIDERAAGKHHLSRRSVVKQVLGFLISSDWVIGEAAALGVDLTETQVRHHFEKIRRQQFPHRGEFARFLHSTGQTVADLLFRVRLNMLSAAIQHKVVSAGHTEKERARALARFIATFKAKWRAQTYCATGFAVADCGHVGTL